jgi:hypothetical protein
MWQVFGSSYHVPSVAQSIALHDADNIYVVEHPIEFEIVPDAPVHTVYYFWAIYLSCEEPSSQRRAIGSYPFLSGPTFHCRTAGPAVSDVPGEMTAVVFAGCKSTKPTSFFGVKSS